MKVVKYGTVETKTFAPVQGDLIKGKEGGVYLVTSVSESKVSCVCIVPEYNEKEGEYFISLSLDGNFEGYFEGTLTISN